MTTNARKAHWLRSRFRLCLALLVAGLFSDITSRVGWRRIYRAVVLWFGLLRSGETVSDEIAERRLAACRGCPIWYAPLETCGSPFLGKDSDLGCWCYMPAKVRLSAASCWLDSEYGPDAPYGWKQNGL